MKISLGQALLLLLPVASRGVTEIAVLFEDKFDSETTDFLYQPDILGLEGNGGQSSLSSWACHADPNLMWGGHHSTQYGKGLHTEFADQTSGGLKLGLLGGLENEGSCGNVGFTFDFNLDRHLDHARMRLEYRTKVSDEMRADPTIGGGHLNDYCEIRFLVDGNLHHRVQYSAGSSEFPFPEQWKKMDVNPGELNIGNHLVEIALFCLTPWSQYQRFEVRFDNFKIVEVVDDSM